jgi:Tfp pilus assembly protein PilN
MDLNLLPSIAKFQAKRIGLKNKLNKIMMVMAGLWLIVVAVIFGWWFLTALETKKQTEKAGIIKQELANMAQELVINQDLKSKAKLVGEVLAARFEYGEAFRAIENLFPEGIEMDKFELVDKKSIDVEGSISQNKMLDVLEEMVEEINKGENKDFSKISLESINYNLGVWKFKVKLELKQ